MSKKSPYNPIENYSFAPIPLNILKHKKLSPGSKLVYGYLCSCFGKDGIICPKISTIGEAVGFKDRQIRKLISELRECRLIKTIRTNRAYRYVFTNLESQDESDLSISDRRNHAGQSNSDRHNRTSQNDSDRHNCAGQKGSDRHDRASQNDSDRHDCTGHDRHNRAGLLYNNKRRLLKDNNNVVVVSSEITFLLDRIREGVNLEDKGLLNALQEGLSKYGQESMIQRIEYANQKADGNYSGFLATMIRKDWSVPDLKKEQKLTSSQPSPSLSLGGETILYKGEKYTVDPVALCIWLKSGAVLPIGKIIQGVNKGTIKVIEGA